MKDNNLPIYERVNYRMDSWEVLGNNTESEKMINQYPVKLSTDCNQ